MKRMIALFILAFVLPNITFAETQYSKNTCNQIYDTIGIFLAIADEAWKSQDEKKALLYSSAAANYATIYETTCR